jgi:hypothetical protein
MPKSAKEVWRLRAYRQVHPTQGKFQHHPDNQALHRPCPLLKQSTFGKRLNREFRWVEWFTLDREQEFSASRHNVDRISAYRFSQLLNTTWYDLRAATRPFQQPFNTTTAPTPIGEARLKGPVKLRRCYRTRGILQEVFYQVWRAFWVRPVVR